MKPKLLLLYLLFPFLLDVKAQSQDNSNLNLSQCIEYAFKNQVDVQNAEIDQEISEGKVKETRAIGYPQITGAAQAVHNPQLQRMFFSPTNPFFATAGGSGGMASNIRQSGDVLVSPNIFQLRNAGDANATLTQLIFNGSYLVGLQAAATYRELSKKSLTQTKIQTVENVTKAYYMVLINKERSNLFSINLSRLDSVIAQTKAYNQSGYIENIDVSRLEVQYNNLLTDKENFDNIYQVSLMLLKFQMGMPIEQPLTINDSITSIQLDSSAIASSFDYTQRIEYSLLKTQEKLQMLDLKRIRFSRLPSLAAFGKYGIIRQDLTFGNLFTNTWYPYSIVGFSLNLPILNLQSQFQAQQSKLAVKKTQNTLASMKNVVELDATNAKLTYLNNLKIMQNQKRNMELAQEVARVTKIKYKEGVGSNLEVVNAESDLKQAQINYYQALYDAMVAKINYQKATGTLYNGQ